MKIAHVSATFPPYQGGTGNVCYYNARELARRGHDVHVFTAAVAGAASEETIEGMRVHRLKPMVQVGNAPLLMQLPGALHGFDVVHLHYPFISGAEFVRYATWRSRTPLVLTFHNDLIGDGARTHLFRYYQRLSANLTVRYADLLCVVSHDHYHSTELAAALGNHAPRVVELSNGVDIDAFSPGDGGVIRQRYGIPSSAKLGLFVAALDRAHHFKGLERLLPAWGRTDPGAWLLVVGDGDLRTAYEQQCAALGISHRVVFAGKVSNLELTPYYRAADVTVFPTAPPESFGLVLIESLACGTPVITSDLPGVRTVVDQGVDGFLVPRGNAEALADRLMAMLTMPAAQRHAMGQAGRRKVEERYAWEQIGARLEAIYCDILRQPSGITKAIPGAAQERTGEN